ncbi:hypothetical protein Tco_1040259, partial [Tanacetum coccineum]
LWRSSCGAVNGTKSVGVSSGWFFVGCTDSRVFDGDCWEELIISCCGFSSLLAVVDRAGLNGLGSGIGSGCSVNVGSGSSNLVEAGKDSCQGALSSCMYEQACDFCSLELGALCFPQVEHLS